MSSLDQQTRKALGKLLRELRMREGLTLAALGERVGVTPSALSQFESGRSEPTLGTLWNLGRALNASLFDFFAVAPVTSAHVTRAEERTVMVHGRARYEAITRSRERHLDLFVLRLQPGDGPIRDEVSHAGEESGLVVSGQLDVTVADAKYRLGPGDGIWFVSDERHTFEVVGDEECVSVWADTLPGQTVAPHEIASMFFDEQTPVAAATHTELP